MVPEEFQKSFEFVAQAIRRAESSSDPTIAYNVVFGRTERQEWFKQELEKFGANTITELSVDQILGVQQAMLDHKMRSTAIGAFQMLKRTLEGLKSSLNLTGDEQFDKDLQAI